MGVDGLNTDILLESGTNELEIVEFCIADEFYGINVAKVMEIIRASIGIVPVPDGHKSISGVINLRGKIIPVVNLATHLKIDLEYDKQTSRIIVAKFNKIQVGFWVNSVTKIHRISWSQVETPSELVQTKGGYAVGIIKIEDKILFLLDFEKIGADINPDIGIVDVKKTKVIMPEVNFDRTMRKILIAEDSAFMRELLVQYTQEAGYDVVSVGNGLEAWNMLEEHLSSPDFKNIGQYYHLLITDIEMPQMDGLHLIKRIKDHPQLKALPCIVFSSMITAELSKKCIAVGADAQIVKPGIDELVKLVDSKIIK